MQQHLFKHYSYLHCYLLAMLHQIYKIIQFEVIKSVRGMMGCYKWKSTDDGAVAFGPGVIFFLECRDP
jgi:hypothetical protein